MASYYVVFSDLLSGAIHGRFQLDSLRFSRKLRDAAEMSGTIPMGAVDLLAKDPIGSTTMVKSAAHIEREESQIVWSGFVWGRRRRGSQPGLQLQGTEFWSYLRRRLIVDSLYFTQVDQLDIVRDLIAYAQGQQMNHCLGHPVTIAKPGGNLGITVGAETSGVLRDVTFSAEQKTAVDQAIRGLAELDQGFDFSIDTMYTAGPGSSITRAFQLNYPRRGRPASQSALRWELGANMLDYEIDEDGTSIATTSYADGPGEGAAMLRSSASAQALIDSGFPLLEISRAYKDASVTQPILNAHAVADSKADGVPAVVTGTVVADGSKRPWVGDFVCGDEARVVINDWNFPRAGAGGADQSFDQFMRILEYTVDVDNNGRETLTLTMGAPLA